MHLRVYQGELQPRSCTCSTSQWGWEVDGSSQLPPDPPHCCFFSPVLLENHSLQPSGAAAALESQNSTPKRRTHKGRGRPPKTRAGDREKAVGLSTAKTTEYGPAAQPNSSSLLYRKYIGRFSWNRHNSPALDLGKCHQMVPADRGHSGGEDGPPLPVTDAALAPSPLLKPAAHTKLTLPCANPLLLTTRLLRNSYASVPSPAQMVPAAGVGSAPSHRTPVHCNDPSSSSILSRSLRAPKLKLQPTAPGPAEDTVRNDHSEG